MADTVRAHTAWTSKFPDLSETLWIYAPSLRLFLQLIRSSASLFLSLVVAQAHGLERWFGSRKLWPFLAARGFIGAASMTLYYEGITRMPLADAVGFPRLAS